ncbi:hypothetical protein KFL_000530260 [Klebsormidium nitens]|uniref:HTH three-helical bundle domain-containing protein n=1 Tax=Klebsormidium nitens TaxID=105231 RepID=A0A1Y1HT77_KLENI|nr:hypothetical protein KFL_000530260 [Klebsormidium nitens]|eukprot:GAQ80399.1 hypothetical protein KFL_000530260 [Klebsormidium nitens]
MRMRQVQGDGNELVGPSLPRHEPDSSPKCSAKHRSKTLLNRVEAPEEDDCPGEEVSSPLQPPPMAKQWQKPPHVLRKLRESAKMLEEEPACVRLMGPLGRDAEGEAEASDSLDEEKKGVQEGQTGARAVASNCGRTGGVKSTNFERPARSRGSLATSCSGMPGLERLDWLASVATECRSPSDQPNHDAGKILRKPRTPVSFQTCKASTLSTSQTLDSIQEDFPKVARGEQEATSPRRKALPLKKRPHKESSSGLAAEIFSPRPVKSPLQSLNACEGNKQRSLEQETPCAAAEKKRKLDTDSVTQVKSPRGLLRSPKGRFVSKKETVNPEEGERDDKSELQKVKRAAELALRVPPEPKKPKLEVEGVAVKKRGRPPKHAREGTKNKEKREGKRDKKAKRSAGNVKVSKKKQAVRVLVKGKGKADEKKKSHKKKPTGGGPKEKGTSGKRKAKVQEKAEKKEGTKGLKLKKGNKLEEKKRAGAFKVAPKTSKAAATPDSSPIASQSATLEACLGDKRVHPSGGKETRIQKFARYILNYIGRERTPESVIRKEMGNTPDTSKALRMLVSDKKVNRRGTGGRPDPFIYKITKKGLTHLEAVHAAFGSMPTQTYHPSAAATPRPPPAADVPETPTGAAHHAPRLVSPGSQEP